MVFISDARVEFAVISALPIDEQRRCRVSVHTARTSAKTLSTGPTSLHCFCITSSRSIGSLNGLDENIISDTITEKITCKFTRNNLTNNIRQNGPSWRCCSEFAHHEDIPEQPRVTLVRSIGSLNRPSTAPPTDSDVNPSAAEYTSATSEGRRGPSSIYQLSPLIADRLWQLLRQRRLVASSSADDQPLRCLSICPLAAEIASIHFTTRLDGWLYLRYTTASFNAPWVVYAPPVVRRFPPTAQRS